MPYALTAETRTATGRRAKHVHDSGSIPGVLYGPGIDPKNLQVSRTDFRKVYRAAGMSSLVDVVLDGSQSVKVLIQEVQVDPISLEPYHIDLRQIRMDQELTIDVPLKLVGEAPAVKGLAGTLVHPLNVLHVKCLPADLPHEIVIDLTKLVTFEDSITVADIVVPKGVTIIDEPTSTVATVVPPLTEDQLKKLEEGATFDVSTIKTEAEEKKAADEAKKAEEAAAVEASK